MPEATQVPEIPDHIKKYTAGEFNGGDVPKDLHPESGGFGFTRANKQPVHVTADRIANDLGADALPGAAKVAERAVSLREKYGVSGQTAAEPPKANEPKAPAGKP